jgi:hypothetical protein
MAKIKKLTTYVAVVVDPSRMHGFTEVGDIILIVYPIISLSVATAWNGRTIFAVASEDIEIIDTEFIDNVSNHD